MPPFEKWWSGVVYALTILKSPFGDDEYGSQQVLDLPIEHSRQFKGPIFEPPSHPEDRPFRCEYPAMTQYVPCSRPDERGCWLKSRDKEYNISTNYEVDVPTGINRRYYLEITNQTISPDGVAMPGGQVFNSSYPGPWLEACWGDTLEITVMNKLTTNGTTIHWHGLRQLGTNEMDGVNGVSQCPIAPGDQMTCKFRAMQYGTSWYHSHYSLQYAVGLAGPLTIHGPSSGSFDLARDPILMTDWSYRNAFDEWSYSIQNVTPPASRPAMRSILLNGTGQYVPTIAEYDAGLVVKQVPKFTTIFQRGKRYLLRLINTSADATFIFSIDRHMIQVVGADFVPISPYATESVLIGIGQRYHIIVEAKPSAEAPGGNYWIRTTVAQGCSSFATTRALPDEKTGILRYDARSPFDPLSSKHTFPTKCSDEPYDKLKPIVPWKVNADASAELYDWNIGLDNVGGPPYYPERKIARWDMTGHPMWLNMSRPTLMNLDTDWDKLPHLAVVQSNPVKESWIEMLISVSKTKPPVDPSKLFIPVAHPIHLHGHDFALLAQSDKPYNKTEADKLIKRDNPPRRDVALVPSTGYIIIAFKADNPGVWLMHCHIAFHASSGLALQIIENNGSISIPPQNQQMLQEGCRKWDRWFKEHDSKDHPVQDDSAI